MRYSSKDIVKKAFTATLPVMTGYLVLAIGFGILLKTKGYGLGWAIAMSGFIYAGSMQYLTIDLLCGGAGLLTTAITTLMVNARHLFYGISMVERYKDTGKKKSYLIFSLTDETYSLVCSEESVKGVEEPKEYYFLVSLFNHSYWVVGSIIGSLLGNIIPFNVEGIDFALTALFVTIFVEQWLTAKDYYPALTGLFISAMFLETWGADRFLIPSMIMIVVLLLLNRKKEEVCENQESKGA